MVCMDFQALEMFSFAAGPQRSNENISAALKLC